MKVNGVRIGNMEKRLDPGDEIAVAKHRYEIRYSPADNSAVGPPPTEDLPNDILSKSLLERTVWNASASTPPMIARGVTMC